MVLHIVRIISRSNEICFETNLSFRVIYPNGTIIPVDISMDKLEMQSLNFCFVNLFDNRLSPIALYAIESNFILVTYVNAEDINNIYTYNEWGMLIDLSGNIHSKALLGPSFIYPDTNQWAPGSSIVVPNVNKDQGFLFLSLSNNYTYVQQWIINDGIFSNITRRSISLPYSTINTIIATVDGGYINVFINDTSSITRIPDGFSPQGGVYAIYYEYGTNVERDVIVLYETTIPFSSFNSTAIDCGISYSGVGQTCVLTVLPNPTTLNPNPNPLFIKIKFLSTGSVINIMPIIYNLIPGYNNTQNNNIMIFEIRPLYYGGFYFNFIRKMANGTSFIWGYVLDDNGNFTHWNLSNPTVINLTTVNPVLPNNTLVIVKPTVDQTWGLITTDLYKVYGRDNHYGNILISNTIPTIGQNFIANEIHSLIITYTIPVVLSNGTITIFQYNGLSSDIIRQVTNALYHTKYVKLIDDYTVNVTIIDSIFNSPINTTYYVIIGNGFVKSQKYNEPLYGLTSNVWHFTATPKVEKQKLANAIAISQDRISTNYRFVIDTESSLKQYLLSIKIEIPQNPSDRGSELIANDLDVMIKNMDITILASGSSSKYLESTYGYATIPKFYNNTTLMFQIILTCGFIGILTIFYFISIYYDIKNEVKNESNVKNDEINGWYEKRKKCITKIFSLMKNHLEIYSYGFNILSFVLDILFAKIEAGSVKIIFIASVFFVTFPYAIKLGYAIYIILEELINTKENWIDTIFQKLCPKWLYSKITLIKNQNEDLDDQNNDSDDQNNDSDDQNNDSDNQNNDSEIQNNDSEIQNNGLEEQKDDSEDQKDEKEISKNITMIKWLESSKNHKIILTILILLAGADIEALEIFNFQFYGYKFNVKLSENFEKKIIYGRFISIIIKNIPDLIIRSYFLTKAIDFSYLSTFPLLISFIKILNLVIRSLLN
ncbi:hypothetical protein GLOIN_2v1869233 [Rhizophagus clarus]|uniref:Uncharacterized protein n=1 Tax=Rhizophagus clarus TaxID=94130 RepID=A0A8H3QQQ9_9GLOM|nr:hypothetical protein GLOIN_2v1869233 [Rhizophagus clarus]